MLKTLSNLLLGSNGGLSVHALKALSNRRHFSDHLPWIAYDEETKVYLNTDNTVGFVFECSPLCFSGSDTDRLLEGLFVIGFPDNSILQFILFAEKHIEPFLQEYRSLKVRNDPLIERATETFMEFLLNGSGGLQNLLGTPVRHFRLFVSIKIPAGAKETNRISIRDMCSTTEEILRGAYLNPIPLGPDGLLHWMRRFFNDNVSPNDFLYDEAVPLRKQVILAETDIKKHMSNMQIGSNVFRCLTPKAIPKEITSMQTNHIIGGIRGMVSDTDQYKTPFMLTINVIFQNLKARLHAKCNLVLQQKGVGSFAPSLQRKQEEYLWATDELEKGTKFVRVMPILWVWGSDDERTRESLTRARRIWEGQGYIMQEDKGILPLLFISALPFGLYTQGKSIDNLDRDFIAPARSVSTLLPVQSDFAGGGRPYLLFIGRKGQICGLDIFDRQVNNHNVFIASGSGSGKSFLVNSLVFNYYASGAKIRIIDIGWSYKKQVNMFNGRYLDFSQKDICLNPFSNVAEPEYDLPMIAKIVAQMAYSATRDAHLSETEMTILKSAVTWAYDNEGNDAEINTVYHYLHNFPKYASEIDFECPDKERCAEDIIKAAHTLAFNITAFTSQGLYGSYFNGRSNFDISRDDYVVLELEHLKPQEDLFNVVLLQVINAVTYDLYLSDRSQPRFILLDEAWQFLSGSRILKGVIEEGYRRSRKYGGSFTVVTQSILDLVQFGEVGNVIYDNSAFKFYLESDSFERAKAEKIIDYDDFTMNLLKTVKTNKPYYSEIFTDTPFGVGIVRLVVDDFSYFLYTSDARETAEIETLVKKGMTYEQAVREMVRKYRS